MVEPQVIDRAMGKYINVFDWPAKTKQNDASY